MRTLVVVAGLVAAATVRAEEAKPAPLSSVQVVVDASKGVPPEALKSILGQLKGVLEGRGKALETSVRLVGGGGRGRDGCGAGPPSVPPGVSPGPVLDALLPRLGPAGPRGLAAALEAAAGDLPRREGTLRGAVVVTAGLDECGRDACELVRDVRRNLGFGQVRVLLVGGDAKTASRLECVGPVERVDAAKVGERVDAFLGSYVDTVELRVTALEGREPVPAEVEAYAAGDEVPLASGPSGEVLALPGGRWHVRVVATGEDGAEREGWRRDVELAPGSRIAMRVALGGARAMLDVRVRLNGREAPPGTRLFVHKPGDVEQEVASGWPDEPFGAPAGTWDLRAVIPGGPMGSIEVWRPELRLRAGEEQRLTLDAVQKQGVLRLEVVSGRERLEDAYASLYPDRARDDEGVSLLVDQDEPTPAGTWTVRVALDTPGGSLVAWRDGVVVKPDERTALTVDLGATGVLTVDVPGLPRDAVVTAAIVRPKELEPVGRIDLMVPTRLPAGKYDLRLEQTWPLPRVWWKRGVVVPAGDELMVLAKPEGA